jgi:penicillin-binding protein 1A
VKFLSFSLKFLVTVAVGAAALAGSVALLGPAGRSVADTATPLGKLTLTINSPATRSVVYDQFGNPIGSFSTQDRSDVTLKQVPQVLINAVLSIEDRKFYEHHGVDWSGTIRALFKNVDAGGVTQGGSTITQQLVKNTLEAKSRKRDLKVKAQEAILAIRLENEMSKSQILEDYLNLVYFGNGAYGVKAAAERYFGTDADPDPLSHLNLAQAALLAGLIQSPEGDNPIDHPDNAARRRNAVLDAMVENKKISENAATLAKSVPLPTTLHYPVSKPLDYYIDEVRNILLAKDTTAQPDIGDLLGSTATQRADALNQGGLQIYTSFNPYIQNIADNAIRDQLGSILTTSPFRASVVVIDNATGDVRAIANGDTFQQRQFDDAVQGSRQAGSSFKVFTLATALNHGYSPNDLVNTSPLTTRTGPGGGSNSFYNLSGDCGDGTITLTQALAKSDNCAFVRTELSLGPGNYGADGVNQVILTAAAMGIDVTQFQHVVTTTLGTNGVSPLQMARAYSVLPNDGVARGSTFITKIVDGNGKTIYQADTTGHQVLPAQVAQEATQMMTNVLRNGTASSTLGNFPRPAAGKTGTTDSEKDAWFDGFTPQYTVAVWMGDPINSDPMQGGVLRVGRVFGATYPAKIWAETMLNTVAQLPPLPFTQPNPYLEPRPSFISEFGRSLHLAFPTGPGPTFPPGALPSFPVTPTSVPTTPTTRPKSPPTTTGSPPTTGGGGHGRHGP